MKTLAATLLAIFVFTFVLLSRTSLTLGTPTVVELRVSSSLTHIFIVQSDGSVLHWRRTP